MTTRIVFVVYEAKFAPWGGITAVMGKLPYHMHSASRLPVSVIMPYHWRIMNNKNLSNLKVGQATIAIPNRQVNIDILDQEDADIHWFFLKPDDEKYFGGKRHPYDISMSDLQRDALLFGKAAALALGIISGDQDTIVMMQDWEAATIALALVGNNKYRLFLTLHNSYDSGAIKDSQLLDAGIEPPAKTRPLHLQEASVLERVLSLPQAAQPVFTVSQQFAQDLTQDLIQTEVMADHLQALLGSRLIGVDNGLFVVPSDELVKAASENFSHLREWKLKQRTAFFGAVEKHKISDDEPIWGDYKQFMRYHTDETIWMVIGGRDDGLQKGYDIDAVAIKKYLARSNEKVQFLFFPLPGDEGKDGLNFLKELAEKNADRVLVLPFLFKDGYFQALRGATYSIMASLFEPFGSAHEAYLHGGAVAIIRATGGGNQQIVPLRAAASFSQAVRKQVKDWHPNSASPTGLLFREKDGIETAKEDWKHMNAAAYLHNNRDRVSDRQRLVLFQAMVVELVLAIEDGVRIHNKAPDLYFQMLTEGIAYLQRTFSWERTAQEYMRYIGL